MNYLKFVTFAALSFSAVSATAQTPPAPESRADKAFAQLNSVTMAPRTIRADRARAEAMGKEGMDEMERAAGVLTVPLAEKFMADYPADPRRWQAAAWLLRARREFTGDDAAARTREWQARRAEVLAELVAAKDADDSMVAGILEMEIYANVGRIGNRPVDLAKATELVELLAKRVPSSDRRPFAEKCYIAALARHDLSAAEALLRKRLGESEINPALARQAAGLLLPIVGRREPLELKFTALDGSAVDLANYRGKAVLVDFWATWCVPCMDEMPNVKRIYQAYHDRGFEILGISLDRNPGDPAKPRKGEKTAQQLKEFLVQHGMPWPQHYDGKFWDNEISRRFAVGSIPATILFGKDGLVVSTDNHGDRLEANVRKALGI